MYIQILTLVFTLCLSLSASAKVNNKLLTGLKFAENPEVEGQAPGISKAIRATPLSFAGGMNKLLPYVISSPYQDDAGSCLFMSHTAVAEWWLSKLGRGQKIDLSERYFMNLSKAGIGDELVGNWQTDTILRLNATKIAFKNSDYPFMKAWYHYNDQGNREFTAPNAPGAYYGPAANWIISLDNLSGAPVPMPHFERTVLHADPSGSQWAVNSTPKDIVAQMKNWFDTQQAPLIVIYNHHAYWHAVMVVGYNDNASSESCQFTVSFTDTMLEKAKNSREEAARASDESERKRLLSKARRDERRGLEVRDELAKNGGCRGKGVFYVRDSLYPDPSLPLYDYDPTQVGEEEHLVAPIILREYEWVERLANHVVGITAQ